MRRFFQPTALALALLAGVSTLSNAGEEPGAPPYNLIFEGSLPDATVLNVAVDAKETKPIALTLVGGKVLNGISIPGEGGRHVVVNAQNADGKVIYEGSFDIDVGKEITPQVNVELKSAIDGTLGELTLASHRVALEFAAVEREGKLFTRLTGDVFDANGRRLELKPGDLDWEIDNPEVRFTPCPVLSGAPPLCVEFEPRRPTGFEISVDACFRKGICKIDLLPPVTPVWRKVATGMGDHACALKLSGELYCWGQGEHGQLGYVAPKDCYSPDGQAKPWGCSGMPQPVVCASGPCRFTDVSVGWQHTCAVDTNQDAWCWGDNYNGNLGTNDFDPTIFGSPVPRAVFGGIKFLSIHAAPNATCGLSTNHEVFCWGHNHGSIIPSLNWEWANDPRLVTTPEVIDSLDFFYGHACGRAANGNLYCWGSNSSNALGSDGFTTAPFCTINCPAAPLLMQPRIPELMGQSANLFSTGTYGTCAHLGNGTTPCWGYALAPYPAGRSLDRLSRGYQHYCTISRGNLQCAGVGFLGDGSFVSSAPGAGPVTVKASTLFHELDTGRSITCAIGNDENVYCWGGNDFGRLGLGLGGGVAKPTALVFPTTIKFPPPNWPRKP